MRSQYGSPDVLSVLEIDMPTLNDDEILVNVHATTVNRTDCGILRGKPFIIRFFTGLLKPERSIPGTDFAGKVEAIGKKVTSFKVGDRVWGFHDNGLSSQAQYMTVPVDKAIALIPRKFSYEQAAASPEGAHYAYHFINKVPLKKGHQALVNGATGAIGSAMVQFLKYFELNVTAVCNTENINLVQSLGADKIIDYKVQDFTQDDQRYHYVFDAVGKSTFGKCKPLLQKGGVYISSELGPWSQNPVLALLSPFMGDKKVKFPLPSDIKGSMRFIQDLIEQGKFRPVIDRTYSMENIAEAYDYVQSGQKTGNVIVTYK